MRSWSPEQPSGRKAGLAAGLPHAGTKWYAADRFDDFVFIRRTGRGDASRHEATLSMTVHADERWGGWTAVVETESASDERASYRVLDDEGELLARVTRTQGGLMPPRRSTWSVELPDGTALRAAKGHRTGWVVWWLCSPFLALLRLRGSHTSMPTRTTWRRNGDPVLAFKGNRGAVYTVTQDWPDPRILYAVAAVHYSHPASLGRG
ncbi:hypothetical protein [Embleya sp. NBC_00896]|uniref:hypothetical protein n=1 Tax=Embleya sp. NBC_00896 TaxID=2975961 RepID=UPI00386F0C66|nr:hypothetical protein OG928_05215 [Embleya sp. NBC_00896]